MAIKIQLDGQALAALIGGNSEIEVELRHGVVEEFARHYLKGIASEDSFKRAIMDTVNNLKSQMENMVKAELEHIGCRIIQTRNGVYQVELPSVVIDQIKNEINKQFNLTVAAVVKCSVQAAVDAFETEKAALITKEVTTRLREKVCRAVCQHVNGLKVQVDEAAEQ